MDLDIGDPASLPQAMTAHVARLRSDGLAAYEEGFAHASVFPHYDQHGNAYQADVGQVYQVQTSTEDVGQYDQDWIDLYGPESPAVTPAAEMQDAAQGVSQASAVASNAETASFLQGVFEELGSTFAAESYMQVSVSGQLDTLALTEQDASHGMDVDNTFLISLQDDFVMGNDLAISSPNDFSMRSIHDHEGSQIVLSSEVHQPPVFAVSLTTDYVDDGPVEAYNWSLIDDEPWQPSTSFNDDLALVLHSSSLNLESFADGPLFDGSHMPATPGLGTFDSFLDEVSLDTPQPCLTEDYTPIIGAGIPSCSSCSSLDLDWVIESMRKIKMSEDSNDIQFRISRPHQEPPSPPPASSELAIICAGSFWVLSPHNGKPRSVTSVDNLVDLSTSDSTSSAPSILPNQGSATAPSLFDTLDTNRFKGILTSDNPFTYLSGIDTRSLYQGIFNTDGSANVRDLLDEFKLKQKKARDERLEKAKKRFDLLKSQSKTKSIKKLSGFVKTRGDQEDDVLVSPSGFKEAVCALATPLRLDNHVEKLVVRPVDPKANEDPFELGSPAAVIDRESLKYKQLISDTTFKNPASQFPSPPPSPTPENAASRGRLVRRRQAPIQPPAADLVPPKVKPVAPIVKPIAPIVPIAPVPRAYRPLPRWVADVSKRDDAKHVVSGIKYKPHVDVAAKLPAPPVADVKTRAVWEQPFVPGAYPYEGDYPSLLPELYILWRYALEVLLGDW